MGILFALFTALCFGINPTVIGKIKTKPVQQQIGTTFTLFIFSLIVFAFTFQTTKDNLTQGNVLKIILISIASGICMTFGQYLQYKSFSYLGTSNGFALSTASILVFNGILSVIIFKDWTTPYQLILGFSSILLIIVGAFMLSYKDKKKKVQEENVAHEEKKRKFIIGLIIIILEGLLFSGNILLPKFLLNDNVAPTTILLFQSIGGVIGALCFICFLIIYGNIKIKKDPNYNKEVIFDKRSFLSIIPGTIYSIANLSLIYANQLIGTAISNSLSQICVSISTLMSLFILKEYKTKTKKELILMISGAFVVALGGVLIGLTALDI